MDEDNNIVKFGQVQGGKMTAVDEDHVPTSPYVIVDNKGREFYHEGFLLFTSQHVAIMQEQTPGNPIPVFMMPLGNLDFAEIVEDDDDLDN